MHIITKKRLVEFYEEHPKAELPLLRWYKIAKGSEWSSVADIKKDFPDADVVGKFIVFNIGGNKFRLVVAVRLKYKKVYIRSVMTHAEYDQGKWKEQ